MENDHPIAAQQHVQDDVNRGGKPQPAVESSEETRTLAVIEEGEITNGNGVVTAAVVVVGVGAALISVELLLGVLIGAAAVLLPGIRGRMRPLLRKTVNASSTVARMTREMVEEAKAGDVPPVPVPDSAGETAPA